MMVLCTKDARHLPPLAPTLTMERVTQLHGRHMSYCSRHGIEHSSGRTCPECRTEREEEQHEELVSALSSLRDTGGSSEDLGSIRAAIAALQTKLLNPGEYQCPHCKRTSLEYEAHVCPICHRDIEDEFWDAIDEAVEAAANEKERAAQKQREAEIEAKRVVEWKEFEREVAEETERLRRKANPWWSNSVTLDDFEGDARRIVARRRRQR
jgi:hypothetical protein